MAVYLFASRISAAVCARASPSPTRGMPWHSSPNSYHVCRHQPKKNTQQKKVVLAVTSAEVTSIDAPADQEEASALPTSSTNAEPPEDLVYNNTHLVSGNLDALTQLLVPTADTFPDRGFMFAFLLTSRLFIHPHELLAQVLASCYAQQVNCDKPSTAKERLERLMPPMVQLLEEWTDMTPYDFREERMTAAVRGISQGCDCVPRVLDRVSILLQNLLDRLDKLERFEQQVATLELKGTTDDRAVLPATDVAEVCGSPVYLAQQLTALELERMSYIGPEEFILAYMRESSHPLHQRKQTNNLESYVAWSSRLSQLVASEICKYVMKKHRQKITEFWVDAAKECFNIGNFNSLAAILAGLNMTAVTRLGNTWTKASTEKLAVLKQAMASSGDYDNYRATLKAAIWRAAGDNNSSNIVIPYFVLFVKDIYGLCEPCSNKLPNGHVNMEAGWQLAKNLTDFISWQQTVSPFSRCGKATAYLQTSPVLSDKALILSSFDCEGPESNKEKEQHINLK